MILSLYDRGSEGTGITSTRPFGLKKQDKVYIMCSCVRYAYVLSNMVCVE